ncbi:MAG: hypothetical protein COC06_03770 [Bacteroidales bacterium]|nr:MAG: hypothetical protein COC06_03770 [Bacteroidales bacterium]
MTDEELKDIEEELTEFDEHFKKTESDGLQNILKHFDRIHDKLFTFNNILIAGYFALSQFFVSFSVYGIIIPLLNLSLLIFIEYRMMKKSRFDAEATKKTPEEIDKNSQAISRTNRYSLYTIISTSVVVVIFLINLFALDSKANTESNIENISTSIKTSDTLQKNSSSVSILGAWTNNLTENSTFSIEADSMIFVDALKYVKYELKSDTLIWYFDDIPNVSKILLLSTDSLVVENEFGIERYVRFKN